ncbi:MAG: T9SS type A sorting domain-containing protein [Bacteroidota bacterium]
MMKRFTDNLRSAYCALFLLGALPLAAQYGGGTGDGHDARPLIFTLTAYDPAVLYSGGAGDGHDAEPLAFTLTAYDPEALYSGGAGDGHDAEPLVFTLTAYDPTVLFGGGNGDGHDMAELDLGALPLDLLTFTARVLDKQVLLQWMTTNETNTHEFTVEKSRDARAFTVVGTLAATGTSTPGLELDYELRDETPWTGTSYYRLRTTDFDGTFSLSELREVTFVATAEGRYVVFPNPTSGRVMLDGPAGLKEVRVMDVHGRTLFVREAPGTELDLSQLKPGMYLLLLKPEKGASAAVRLRKQ